MAIQTLPAPSSDGGLKTIADLYELINGKSTVTSGGTATRTEQNTISKEGMDAALANIIGGTNGLAAVSGGQRSAGGYNSSVNTLLTNDLLTRAAGQVAQANSTKTITETKSPQTVQAGGVSVKGAAKTAGFLTALQSLSKLGLGDMLSGKKKDSNSSSEYPANVDALQENYSAYNNPGYSGSLSSPDSLQQAQAPSSGGGIDFNSFLSTFDAGEQTPSYGDTSSGGQGTTFVDNIAAPDVSSQPEIDYPEYDSLIGGFADGGSVKKKSLFNETQYGDSSSSGGDPTLQSAASGQTPSSQSISSSQSVSSPQSSPSVNTSPESGNDSTSASTGDTPTGGIDISDIGLSNIGKGLGIAGALSGNSDLSMLGSIAGVFGSSNPALSAGVAVGNALTNGAAGAALSLARDPSLTTVADIVLGAISPAYGVVNSLASMFGQTINPVQIAANAQRINNPNQMMSETQTTEASQDKALNSTNPTGGTTSVDSTTGASVNLDPAATDVLGNPSNTPNSSTVAGFNDIDLGPAISTGNDSGGYGGGNDSGAGPGDGGSGAGGDMGGVGGWKNGGQPAGKVQGPGSTTSDSIPIKVSQGEYILPADVVSMIGVEKLDKMVDKYHVPAAVQKLQAYANGGVVRSRSEIQKANDRGEIPEETPSQKFNESLFERRKAAMDAKIEADSRGEDGNSAYSRRMQGGK